MIPITVQSLEELQARYPAALGRVYDLDRLAEWMGNGARPSDKPEHVFDFVEGVRLIVSLERFQDGRRMIHLSASLSDRQTPWQALRMLGLSTPYEIADLQRAFRKKGEELFSQLSGRTVPPGSFIGWSPGKQIPHWAIPEES